jgi:hypothetical protein
MPETKAFVNTIRANAEPRAHAFDVHWLRERHTNMRRHGGKSVEECGDAPMPARFASRRNRRADAPRAGRSAAQSDGRIVRRHHAQVLAVERGELAFEFRIRTRLPGE